jgi:hypothetical protein
VIEEFYSRIDGKISPIFPPARGAGIDAYFRRMGLWRLVADGTDIKRVATPAAESFLRHTLASPPGAAS